jgi:hypothetical protein
MDATARSDEKMRPVRDLDFLLGSWSVERSINDAMSGDIGTFHGTATFIRDAEDSSRVRFDETGIVRFGDYSGRANRQLYLALGSNSVIDVSFADGHHFITLDFSEQVSTDHHQCQSDGYDIMTLVRSDDLIEERWRVVGPAKDYEAVTFMTRVTTTPE